MKILNAALIAVLCLLPVVGITQSASDMSKAEKLTVIASPKWGDRETTLRRFQFLLGKFQTYCANDGGPCLGAG